MKTQVFAQKYHNNNVHYFETIYSFEAVDDTECSKVA